MAGPLELMDRHLIADGRMLAANQADVGLPKQRLLHDSGVKIGESSHRDIHVARLQAIDERCFIERDGDEAHVGGAFVGPFMETRQDQQVSKIRGANAERARGGKRLESRGMLEPFLIDFYHGLYSVRERSTDRRG